MAVISYAIPDLPPVEDLETRAILKALVAAKSALAELKGTAGLIPNPGILIDTLALQEAQASSEIENIVTTQDELFRVGTRPVSTLDPNQKEVARYRDALRLGHEALAETGLLTNNTVIAMYRLLKRTEGGFRTTPGTTLRNDHTREVVYLPPQHPDAILRHMGALERFVNAPIGADDLDPLVRMALIHHQFESIHPFSDGNGRIGRIVNILYLVRTGLLEAPILYLSRYITKTKQTYYTLLQSTRDTGQWAPWVLYILKGVEVIARETILLIERIREMMGAMKRRLRGAYGFYSQDLLNNLFRHPYTRIGYVMDELGVSRVTAGKYLNRLVLDGVLVRVHSGRNVYFVNEPLVALFHEGFDG